MRNPLFFLPLLGFLTGCNAILGNRDGKDAIADAGVEQGEEEAAEAGTEAGKDSGAPPVDPPDDSSCQVTWTEESRVPDGECKRRRVITLHGGIQSPLSLSLMHTTKGRLGVAVHNVLDADSSELVIDQFTPPKKATDAPQIQSTRFAAKFQNVGTATSLARGDKDELYLLYQSLAGAGEISFVKVTSNGPGAAETVATGIAEPTYVSLAVSRTGEAIATYFEPKSAELVAKIRPKGGVFGERTVVHGLFKSGGIPGSGQSSAGFDDTNAPVIAYHRADVPLSTQPWFTSWSASPPGWFAKQQIETPSPSLNSMKGYSISLGTFGSKRHVAYFASGTSDMQIQLRYGSWTGSEEPNMEIRADAIEINDPLRPHANVSLAVDRLGRVHLAAVIPDRKQTSVKYFRQAKAGDSTKWLTDEVDHTYTLDGVDSAVVAITVDDYFRPHIVYQLSTDSSLHYASYFEE